MRKLVASCSVVLIATAALVACGGSSSKTSESPSATTPGGDSNSSDSDSDFAKLVDEANKARFKIVYTSDGDDEQLYEQDGNGNSVFGSGDSLTFISKDATISCNKNDGKDECTQSPVSIGALGNPFVGILGLAKTYFTALGGKFGDTSSKDIAGRDAECVTFSAKDIGGLGGAIAGAAGKSLKGSATFCIDKETGAPLEVSGTDGSGKESTTLLVTKFEDPDDADFTPPATPSTVPGLGSITIPSLPGD